MSVSESDLKKHCDANYLDLWCGSRTYTLAEALQLLVGIVPESVGVDYLSNIPIKPQNSKERKYIALETCVSIGGDSISEGMSLEQLGILNKYLSIGRGKLQGQIEHYEEYLKLNYEKFVSPAFPYYRETGIDVKWLYLSFNLLEEFEGRINKLYNEWIDEGREQKNYPLTTYLHWACEKDIKIPSWVHYVLEKCPETIPLNLFTLLKSKPSYLTKYRYEIGSQEKNLCPGCRVWERKIEKDDVSGWDGMTCPVCESWFSLLPQEVEVAFSLWSMFKYKNQRVKDAMFAYLKKILMILAMDHFKIKQHSGLYI